MQGERLKKPKYVYKTAEELIATGPAKRQMPEVTSELAKVKVIDMTGKEQRVLSGISNFLLLLADEKCNALLIIKRWTPITENHNTVFRLFNRWHLIMVRIKYLINNMLIICLENLEKLGLEIRQQFDESQGEVNDTCVM